MTFGFLQAAVLFGLAGLAIPVLIHLWNRRRAPVVDWGAMQFLQLQPAQKRRLLLEDMLLLLLRLAVVAFIVLALAGPIARGPAVAAWTRPPRDIVFVIDASSRMNRRDVTPSPWIRAFEIVADEVAHLGPNDHWTLIAAGRPIETPFEGFRSARQTVDWEALRKEVTPSSRASVPAAIDRAWKMLDDRGQSQQREIVIFSDGLRDGWTASPEWERLASRWAEADPNKATTLRQLTVADGLNPNPANYRLNFLTTLRSNVGAGQRVRFEVRVSGGAMAPPPTKVRMFIDDQVIREDADMSSWSIELGQCDVRFDCVFRDAGPHHVRVELTPPMRDGRLLDAFPADNTCEVVVNVVHDLSVLIVDGAETLTPESPAFFLMNAFAGVADQSRISTIAPKRIAWNQFGPNDLSAGPTVVILADVPILTAAQSVLLDRYVRNGGSALVLFGSRAQPKSYADSQVRGETGWLPFRLTEFTTAATALGVDDATLRSPAFSVFRSKDQSGLANLRFSRWWRGTPDPSAAVRARFAGGDPWLIAQSIGKGSVVVSTVPFDRAWDNNLAGSWEFPVLAHELVFALAQGATPPFNLAPGEPIRLSPTMFEPPLLTPMLPLAGVLERPGGTTRPVLISTWPGIVDAPGPNGVYRLRVADRVALPFVVSDGEGIGDCGPLTAADKNRLREIVPISWDSENGAAPAVVGQAEVGRWLFLGLLAFLCLESWLARRMAGSR